MPCCQCVYMLTCLYMSSLLVEEYARGKCVKTIYCKLPRLSVFTRAGLFVRWLLDSHLMTDNVPRHSEANSCLSSFFLLCLPYFSCTLLSITDFFITVVSLYCLWHFAKRTKKASPWRWGNEIMNNIFFCFISDCLYWRKPEVSGYVSSNSRMMDVITGKSDLIIFSLRS